MKVQAIGVHHSKGISKKTKQPFEMWQVAIIQDAESVNLENYQRQSTGLQVAEVDLTVEGYNAILKVFKPGQINSLDLVTDTVMRFGKIQMIVVGVKTAELKAAA